MLLARLQVASRRTFRIQIEHRVFLDDRFHETGLDETSLDGTGIMLVDSSFEKS
jgi:hypothetical protein